MVGVRIYIQILNTKIIFMQRMIFATTGGYCF